MDTLIVPGKDSRQYKGGALALASRYIYDVISGASESFTLFGTMTKGEESPYVRFTPTTIEVVNPRNDSRKEKIDNILYFPKVDGCWGLNDILMEFFIFFSAKDHIDARAKICEQMVLNNWWLDNVLGDTLGGQPESTFLTKRHGKIFGHQYWTAPIPVPEEYKTDGELKERRSIHTKFYTASVEGVKS